MCLVKLANSNTAFTDREHFDEFLDRRPDYKQQYHDRVQALNKDENFSQLKDELTMGPQFQQRQRDQEREATMSGLVPGAIGGGILSHVTSNARGGRRGLITAGGALGGAALGGVTGTLVGKAGSYGERERLKDRLSNIGGRMQFIDNEKGSKHSFGSVKDSQINDFVRSDWLKQNVFADQPPPRRHVKPTKGRPNLPDVPNTGALDRLESEYNAERVGRRKQEWANVPLSERGQGDPGTYLMFGGTSVRDHNRPAKLPVDEHEPLEYMPEGVYNDLIDIQEERDRLEESGASEEELQNAMDREMAIMEEHGIFYD